MGIKINRLTKDSHKAIGLGVIISWDNFRGISIVFLDMVINIGITLSVL